MMELTNVNSPDFDLMVYQGELSHRLLAAIMSEADRLTLNRSKPSLEAIRTSADEIVIAALDREQAVFGQAIGEVLLRGAAHEVDLRASDMGVVPTCMSAFMVARVRYRKQLL